MSENVKTEQNTSIKETHSTTYQCSVCKHQYDTREKAEACANPRVPKFNIGDLVVVNESLIMAAPGGDEFSRDYDHIPKGSIGKISGVSDENTAWSSFKKSHPKPVYYFKFSSCDCMRFYAIRERELRRATDEDVKKLQDKIKKKHTEVDELESILKEIKK